MEVDQRNDNNNRLDDPRTKYETDPGKGQEQIEEPGLENELESKADHGEESYVGYGRLKDKVALITGGDSGIGRAVAIAFAREGADVAFGYLEAEEEDADETVSWIEKAGRRALKLPGDISDEAVCKRLVEQTVAQFGRIDILVNNAAHQLEYQAFSDVTSEDWEKTWKVNVFSNFWLAKLALPHIPRGGSIIQTSSINAFTPSKGLIAYAPTKAAQVSFTKVLSQWAMEKGVRVNAVAPGPVWTPLIPATLDHDHIQQFGGNTEQGRAAQPAEMAPVYAFLASNDASYVTGEVYGATGGRSPY